MWLFTLSANEIFGLILVSIMITVFGTYWIDQFTNQHTRRRSNRIQQEKYRLAHKARRAFQETLKQSNALGEVMNTIMSARRSNNYWGTLDDENSPVSVPCAHCQLSLAQANAMRARNIPLHFCNPTCEANAVSQ